MSSKTKQILLARLALRSFCLVDNPMIRQPESLFSDSLETRAHLILRLFRCALTVFTSTTQDRILTAPVNWGTSIQSAHLKHKKNNFEFQIIISKEITYIEIEDVSLTTIRNEGRIDLIPQGEVALDVFSDETMKISRYNDLTNRAAANHIALNLVNERLWLENYANENIGKSLDFIAMLDKQFQGAFTFWRDWYQGFVEGNPLDWGLQREVALIPDEDWDKGPAHIAYIINKIRNNKDNQKLTSPSSKNKNVITSKITQNRDALAVTIVGIKEQISDFNERVRGLNHLEPDFRTELLDYLEKLSGHLDKLLHDLPTSDETISDETANKFVLWLRDFKPLITKKASAYISPDNVSEAAIPTSIILGCTGVGSMMGMPLAGAAVGGLITGQIKPGKAASDLFKPSKPDIDEQ